MDFSGELIIFTYRRIDAVSTDRYTQYNSSKYEACLTELGLRREIYFVLL